MGIFDKLKGLAGSAKDKTDEFVERHSDKVPDSVEGAYNKASKAAEKVVPGNDAGVTLKSYHVPAFIQDFPEGSAESTELNERWSVNITGWIAQAQPPAPSYFYTPVGTDFPSTAQSVIVDWTAFPGRLPQFYSASPPQGPPAGPYDLSSDQIYALAETGYYAPQASFPEIPATLCPEADWTGELRAFGPYGPRGWLDEYCEWSTVRNDAGKLVRADFTCENPEYWNTVWKVSPETVCSLYESTLNFGAPAANQIAVTLEDLQLYDANGAVVTDPDTGRPAYNPLNKWNSGPTATRGNSQATGGAMHLTSTPNTLQTELGLAGAATVQYQPPGAFNQQTLICCGSYGQEYRNSDPHIGFSVNQVVAGKVVAGAQQVNLADPVGLYIQVPAGQFGFGPNAKPGTTIPADAKAADVYQIVRGSEDVVDPVTGENFPGNMILHAVCQIPESWLAMTPTLTLEDMTYNYEPLKWAGQITSNAKIGLFARPLPTSSAAPAEPCATSSDAPGKPKQCMWAALWAGYSATEEVAPTGEKMLLASNSTFIPPWVPSDGSAHQLVMTVDDPGSLELHLAVLLADGSGPDTSITVSVTGTPTPCYYAIPGDSYPGSYMSVSFTVTVPTGTNTGLRGIQVAPSSGGATIAELAPMSLPAAIFITDPS